MAETVFFTIRLLINVISYDTSPETVSNHVYETYTNKTTNEEKNK
jgi:hypothetical protein